MPDSKITALTSISTSTDPANDPLVIVDVSDTSMAATGTTKKVTLNQLLGAGGTATLASATITGDLTVDTNVLKVDTTNNRVGIGTASPTETLHVSGGAGDGVVKVSNSSSGNSYIIARTTGEMDVFNAANSSIRFSTNGTLQATLNSTGLGVGDAPATNARLTIGSTNATGFQYALRTTGITTGRSQIYLANTSGDLVTGIEGSTAGATITGSAAYSAYIGTATSNPFYLVTGGSVRATVDTSGNVGIGVTPSAWGGTYKALQINTYGSVSATSTATNVASNWFWTGSANNYIATGFATLYQQISGTHAWYTAPSGTGGTGISFTQAMTLDASGRLLVGPTSANTSGGVLQLSSGITFPATQVASSDANTLDDYEEGTFTPAITGTVTAGVGTYSNQIGRYTKVGNQVTVWIRLSWSAHTGSGDMTITGLPFTLANVNNLGAGAAIGYTANISITAGNYLTVYGDSGFARAYFWQTPTGGGSTNTVAVDASGDIGLTMTYFV